MSRKRRIRIMTTIAMKLFPLTRPCLSRRVYYMKLGVILYLAR